MERSRRCSPKINKYRSSFCVYALRVDENLGQKIPPSSIHRNHVCMRGDFHVRKYNDQTGSQGTEVHGTNKREDEIQANQKTAAEG